MTQIREEQGPNLDKYSILQQLSTTNERLYFKVLEENLVELLPIVYTPTVGDACMKFDRIYRYVNANHSRQWKAQTTTISAEMIPFVLTLAHRLACISPLSKIVDTSVTCSVSVSCAFQRIVAEPFLENWPHPELDIIVVTDGGRILGLGDLGTNGMGISIGKIALYVAGGGFHPNRAMPVCLDVGTNRSELVQGKWDVVMDKSWLTLLSTKTNTILDRSLLGLQGTNTWRW